MRLLMGTRVKGLEILRIQLKIRDCRPLEFGNKLLKTASKVGAKVPVLHAVNVKKKLPIKSAWEVDAGT